MANRFETPLESKFINTYVPIPFQEMMQAGQMKQQRYDQGAAAVDQSIAQTEAINAIAGTRDDLRKQQYIKDMHSIRDQYAGRDLSDPFVIRDMNSSIRSKVDSSMVQKMNQSYMAHEEAQKAKRTLAMNNKWNDKLDKDPANKDFDSAKGIYDYAPRAFQGSAELFDPYYDNMKDDYSRIEDIGGYAHQVYGVSDKKIREVSSKAAQELTGTAAGRDHVDLYRQAHPEDTRSENAILNDIMYDYGKNRASANYRVLGASLQKQRQGAGDDSISGQHSMTTYDAGRDSIPGKNPKEKLKTIETQYKDAQEIVANSTLGSAEYNEASGIVNKYNLANRQAETLAREEIDPKINTMKAEAFTKLRAIPAFKDMSDEAINDVIDQHVSGKGMKAGINRFGATVNNAADMMKASIPWVAQVLTNVTSGIANIALGTNVEAMREAAVAKAIEEIGDKEDYTFGDLLETTGKAIGNLFRENKTTFGTDAIEKHWNTDDMNILRDVTLNVKRAEKEVEAATNDLMLDQYQYVAQDKLYYPNVTTKDNNGNHYIVDDEGKKIGISQIGQIVKHLPATMDGKEITKKNKKGVYEVLKKDKDVEDARLKFSTYDMNGDFTAVRANDNGDIVLRMGYTPNAAALKDGAKTELYEVVIKKDTDEALGLIRDRLTAGKINEATRLLFSHLHTDVKQHINSPEGHNFPILFKDNKKQEIFVKIDPATSRYFIEINGESPYIDPTTGEVIPVTQEDVENFLFKTQEKAYFGQ